MQTIKLYIKDWLAIHPYIQQQATDRYFVDLANRLYSTCTIREIPESIKKKLCLYTAAYFEDVISGLGLWQAFIKKHLELYDTSLPFYTIRPDYIKDEINEEDIRFIIWNTLEKAPYKHPYINPMDRNIEETSHSFFRILDEEYETASTSHIRDAPQNIYISRLIFIFLAFSDTYQTSVDMTAANTVISRVMRLPPILRYRCLCSLILPK